MQQTGERILVSDGPATFIKLEKHLEVNCPEEWARILSFREDNDSSDTPPLTMIKKKSPPPVISVDMR